MLPTLRSTALKLALFSIFMLTASGAVANEIVEVPIEKVLVPSQGFDNNDQIQIVIHGNLPDTCHLLSNYKLERLSKGQIRIRQFAVRLSQGYCRPTEPIPPHFMLHIPFTTEIPLGQLPASPYQIIFKDPSGGARVRNFQVAAARSPSIDEYPYASVTDTSGAPIIKAGAPTSVEMHGILNSSCVQLKGVKAVKLNDVFVVMPTVEINSKEMCLDVIRPWSYKLELGALTEGHYLVHVRGMNGSSINHVFQVIAE